YRACKRTGPISPRALWQTPVPCQRAWEAAASDGRLSTDHLRVAVRNWRWEKGCVRSCESGVPETLYHFPLPRLLRLGLLVNCFRGSWSKSCGSTSGTVRSPASNFSLLPRRARSSSYSTVRRADSFSATAELIS